MPDDRNLCFDVSPYQRHLWRYHKLVEPAARESEKEGEERYASFSSFAGEVFHRLYADEEQQLEEPASGSDVYQRLHEQIGVIPEFDDLRKRCEGDERWAGISTGAMLDTILTSVSPPDQPLEDVANDEQALTYLKAALGRATDPAEVESIEEVIQQVQAALQQKQQAIQDAANAMDPSDIRNAIRAGASAANEAIDEEESLLDSFYAGHGNHSGRQQRQAASRKLATAIKDNDRLKRIAELAGRLRRIAVQQQKDKPRRGTDEVTGVEIGDDMGRLVSSEMLWADDSCEEVFASKYYERSLMLTELNKVPPKQQGPIVAVLDSSGSMSMNHADAWAAAVTLAFLEIARRQNRAFAIVHFGYEVLRVDEWAKSGDASIEEILDAVGFFAADGGTNFMDSLDKAVEIIRNQGSFKEADVVMITDGCADVNSQWLKQYDRAREDLGFTTYSILVGGSTRADTNERFSDDVVHLDDVLRSDEKMHRFFGAV